MNCMKCGREIDTDQVFCDECLADMEKYPVSPLTVVQIPTRSAGPGAKKVHQRRQTPEEQIAVLEKKCRRLVATVLVMLLLLVVCAVGIGIAVSELDMQRWLGQNYSTATEPIATTTSFDLVR